MSSDKRDEGQFAYEGLDRVIHERARLGVLTSLIAHPRGLVFGDLRRLCQLTDGNLSRHLAVLQEAGLVEIDQSGPAAQAGLLTGDILVAIDGAGITGVTDLVRALGADKINRAVSVDFLRRSELSRLWIGPVERVAKAGRR